PDVPISRGTAGPPAGRDPVHLRNHRAREPGDPASVYRGGYDRPRREAERHTPMTNGRGKADRVVVPEKPSNKAERLAAEAVEGRDLAKGNSLEHNALRTQSRNGAPSALERIRQAARKEKKQRFTALLHHVYDVERLRRAYLALRRDAA